MEILKSPIIGICNPLLQILNINSIRAGFVMQILIGEYFLPKIPSKLFANDKVKDIFAVY